MSELAHRFSQGTHKIIYRPRGDRARTEFRADVERDYVHILFTDAAGEIELGFPSDRARSDLSGANWDASDGSIHLEGELGLNGTPVRCVVDLDLRTMEGIGRLDVLAPATAGVTGAMQEQPDLTSTEGLAGALGLDRGEVASVTVTFTASTGHSWLTFLEVTYTGAAAARSPARLVLKQRRRLPLAKPEPMREVDFYSGLAPTLPSPPVVRCLAACAPSADAAGYVLIEDLRATHAEPPLDEERYYESAVDALARIHAARWEARDLPADASQTEPWIRTNLKKIAAHLPAFFDAAGDALRPAERALYERVFSSTLRPWLRPLDGRAVTLTHGSAHLANLLFARDPGGEAYLVDWERWRVDLGARDLAYLMMLRRSPNGRRQLEETLLRRYLERLDALGVRGYVWDDLWTDYRRCWVRNLTAPIRKQYRSDESWRELLDHAVAAYADLDCEELL
jgi:aminoglycoside phosphotransferase (APT) family kinase protein